MKNNLDGLRISNEEINKITRESIQEALIYLLGKKDIEDISITEIVEKAGVSRSAYYRNYQSKEEILKDFSMNVFDLLFSSLENNEYINSPREWLIFLFSKLESNSKLLKLLIKARQNSLITFHKIIDKSKYTIDEKYQIVALENGISAIVEAWLENDFDLSVEEMADIGMKTFNNIGLLFK